MFTNNFFFRECINPRGDKGMLSIMPALLKLDKVSFVGVYGGAGVHCTYVGIHSLIRGDKGMLSTMQILLKLDKVSKGVYNSNSGVWTPPFRKDKGVRFPLGV